MLTRWDLHSLDTHPAQSLISAYTGFIERDDLDLDDLDRDLSLVHLFPPECPTPAGRVLASCGRSLFLAQIVFFRHLSFPKVLTETQLLLVVQLTHLVIACKYEVLLIFRPHTCSVVVLFFNEDVTAMNLPNAPTSNASGHHGKKMTTRQINPSIRIFPLKKNVGLVLWGKRVQLWLTRV